MGKMSASWSGSDRYAGRSGSASDHTAGARSAASAPELDPEMLDLVQRFERGYAELAPADEAPRSPVTDELFPEFPDIFEEPAAARPAASESRRVVPMPRRDAEPASAAPAWPRETRADAAGEVDLDEAMAILRAAEQKSRAAATPGEDEEAAPEARQPRASSPRAEPAPAVQWATRSHATRTIAMAAAVAALAIGVAAGYVLGRGPSVKAPSAPIESSSNGGTQLRLERNLPRP